MCVFFVKQREQLLTQRDILRQTTLLKTEHLWKLKTEMEITTETLKTVKKISRYIPEKHTNSRTMMFKDDKKEMVFYFFPKAKRNEWIKKGETHSMMAK